MPIKQRLSSKLKEAQAEIEESCLAQAQTREETLPFVKLETQLSSSSGTFDSSSDGTAVYMVAPSMSPASTEDMPQFTNPICNNLTEMSSPHTAVADDFKVTTDQASGDVGVEGEKKKRKRSSRKTKEPPTQFSSSVSIRDSPQGINESLSVVNGFVHEDIDVEADAGISDEYLYDLCMVRTFHFFIRLPSISSSSSSSSSPHSLLWHIPVIFCLLNTTLSADVSMTEFTPHEPGDML